MIQLQESIKQEIDQHGVETYPHECCGFLFGTESDEKREITSILKASNHHEGNHRRRFRIDPKEYMKAESFAEKNNMDFLGIYHSHPDHPSLPSEHDRKQAMPFFSYIIVSIKNGNSDTVQSWRLNSEFQFEEEKIKTI